MYVGQHITYHGKKYRVARFAPTGAIVIERDGHEITIWQSQVDIDEPEDDGDESLAPH